jgi:hypothetical protein
MKDTLNYKLFDNTDNEIINKYYINIYIVLYIIVKLISYYFNNKWIYNKLK